MADILQRILLDSRKVTSKSSSGELFLSIFTQQTKQVQNHCQRDKKRRAAFVISHASLSTSLNKNGILFVLISLDSELEFVCWINVYKHQFRKLKPQTPLSLQ